MNEIIRNQNSWLNVTMSWYYRIVRATMSSKQFMRYMRISSAANDLQNMPDWPGDWQKRCERSWSAVGGTGGDLRQPRDHGTSLNFIYNIIMTGSTTITLEIIVWDSRIIAYYNAYPRANLGHETARRYFYVHHLMRTRTSKTSHCAGFKSWLATTTLSLALS